MKKSVKIVRVLLLTLILITIFSNVYAATDTCTTCQGSGIQPGSSSIICPNCKGTGSVTRTSSGGIDTSKFKPEELTGEDYNEAFNMASTIVGALTTIGMVIAVVGIIILGLKYMMGSVEEKADYKKTMIPYLVGCILIFCISKIVSIIYSLVSQL